MKKASVIKGKSHHGHRFYMSFTRINSCRIHIKVFRGVKLVFRGWFRKSDFGDKNMII